MSVLKKIMYVILGALASAVMVSLVFWGTTQKTAALVVAAALGGTFLLYFLGLALWNMRTGWADERTPHGRALSSERLLFDVYPHRRGIAVDIYLDKNAEETVRAIARIHKNEGSDADMGALSSVYIGSTVIKEKEIPKLKNKVLAVNGQTDIPALENCKGATVIPY